jgi:putative transposase
MQRVERHIIIGDKNLDNLCFLSKNLYNYANYIIRQAFINKEQIPSEYEITKMLAKEKQVDYIALPAQTSQQVIKLLYKNWKSFFLSCKAKDKLKASPRIPKYKHKTKGRNVVVFTNQQCKIKDGYIHFPKKANIPPLKTNVTNLCQVRIVPQCSCHAIEVVYEKEKETAEWLDESAYLSIDLGLDNLATSFDPQNNHCFVINGRPLKSINQYFNKKRALLMSYIGNRGMSNRIGKLTLKRNCKVHDYMHKASRFIINYCKTYGIGTIIIGNNDNWKQNCNMGKRNNQNFVSIPFEKLISMIQYKAEEVGIKVIITEEAYTSKVDHYSNEVMSHHESYIGKRIQRGLFRSGTGKLINADLNGVIGILRKVVGESLWQVADRGVVATPKRISFS